MSMPSPTPGGTRSSAVADLQRLGEQVVGHVEEVGQLAGAARGELVGGAEGDGARGADLAVDLVAHHDLEAQALGEVVDALRGGESGARGLDADRGGGPAEHLAGHVGRGRDRLVGDERDVELLAPASGGRARRRRGTAPRRTAGRGRPSPAWRAATPRRSSRGCRRRTARPRRRSARAGPARPRCPASPGGGRPSP